MNPRHCFLFVAIMLGLTICFMAGLWMVDVAAGAISSGEEVVGIQGVQDPFFIYHLGFVISICSFVAMSMIAAYGVTRT